MASTQPVVERHGVTGSTRSFPKSQLARMLTGESMSVFTCGFSLFICDAQSHRTGRLKERRGAVESPTRLAVSLCQGQRGLASLLPSSWHLAEILKKKNPIPAEKQCLILGVEAGDPVRRSPPSVLAGTALHEPGWEPEAGGGGDPGRPAEWFSIRLLGKALKSSRRFGFKASMSVCCRQQGAKPGRLR